MSKNNFSSFKRAQSEVRPLRSCIQKLDFFFSCFLNSDRQHRWRVCREIRNLGHCWAGALFFPSCSLQFLQIFSWVSYRSGITALLRCTIAGQLLALLYMTSQMRYFLQIFYQDKNVYLFINIFILINIIIIVIFFIVVDYRYDPNKSTFAMFFNMFSNQASFDRAKQWILELQREG
jgi:hypothetical protein